MMAARFPAVMQALAALESWLLQTEPGQRRALSVEYSDNWRASLVLGVHVAEHHGVTIADALAQAAQVVISDPNRIGAP